MNPPRRLPEESGTFYWLHLLRALGEKWPIPLSAALSGALFGLLLSAFQMPLFHAGAVVEIQGITDNILKAQDGNPNAGADAELTDIQTQIRIMQSGTLVGRALRRLTNPNRTPAELRALSRAGASLTVRSTPQTRLVEIGSDSTDGRIAAEFVNTLADEFITQHIESRWQGTEQAAGKLTSALDEMRAKLEKSEDSLQDYARQSGLVLNSDRNSVSEDKLRQLQAELSQATADRVSKQSRWEAVSHAPSATLPAVLNDPAIQTAIDKLTDLRRQIAELETTYTADYSKVKRLRAQVPPLETSIEHQTAGDIDRIRSEFDESHGRESLLTSTYTAQAQLVSDEAGRKIHYDVLRREVDSSRSLYDAMLARVKEAAIASTMRGSNVRVLDPAKPPNRPFQPRRAQLSLLAGLVSLFLGCIFVIARDQTNATLDRPGDIHLLLGLPEWGAIPAVTSLYPAQLVELPAPAPFADAFRGILTSLLLAPTDTPTSVLAVTSAHPGEGKTTVAARLAIALASIGKRVLLIDGDLRRPRLHHVFDSPESPGLAALLDSDTALTPGDLIQETSIPRLHLLPAGETNLQSPDLLHSPRLAELIAYSREFFEIVLIDTPPMLQIPDARVVGRAADAVLLIVGAGRTAREAALAVCQRFSEDRTAVIGSILNRWNPQKSPGYYGPAASRKFAPSQPVGQSPVATR